MSALAIRYGMRVVPIDWGPLATAYLIMAIVGGGMVEASLQLAIASFAFRMPDTLTWRIFVDHIFNNFGSYPMVIYGHVAEWLLTFAVPVAFVAYFPATVLLDRTAELRVNPVFAYAAPIMGIGLFIATYLLWQRQLNRYDSPGH